MTERDGILMRALARVLKPHLQAIADGLRAHDARLRQLEAADAGQRLIDSYRGTWREGQSYEPGSLVTFQGGLWLCHTETTGRPAGGSSGWSLCVKAPKVRR